MSEKPWLRDRRVNSFLALATTVPLWYGVPALAHEAPGHVDPELIAGWVTWLHLTFQWLHLTAFALWLGLTAGTLFFGTKPSLDQLLYGSWILFVVLLATGTYNMEWSSGISQTPSLIMLPLLKGIPYAVSYTATLWVKVGLFALAVLLTLVVTLLHAWRIVGEKKLSRIFLLSASALAIAIVLAASVVLLYHEAADLWPTRLHSHGGVAGPEGPRQAPVEASAPPPNNFNLFADPQAWIDIGLRWLHLLGFGLWTGGSAWILVFGGPSPRRFLWVSWLLLAVLVVSGVFSMGRWTPFYLSPYLWNLQDLSHLRFGRTYTLWMAAKHALVFVGLGVLGTATCCYLRALRRRASAPFRIKSHGALTVLVGLAIGYIMMVILLLHEGVDHAL